MQVPDLPDSDLVAATLAGDAGAFGTLATRHGRQTRELARRLLGNAAEADDVTQEALLTSYLDLARLRQPERFGAWLFGIVTNLAKMRLRDPSWGWASLEDLEGGHRVPAGLLEAPDPSPEQAAETSELTAIVRAALSLLPPGQREAVLLHYLDGLSCQEVAALLGRSTGAVRVRLHRARADLRERLLAAAPDLAPPPPKHPLPIPTEKESAAMIEAVIEDIVVRLAPTESDGDPPRLAGRPLRIVLLREKTGERRLPIWIGQAEGDALAFQLAGEQPPRPMSADLTARLLELAGAQITQVTINRLEGNTFFATVTLTAGSGSHDVDARPSDALNLATRLSAPILIAEELLADAHAPDAGSFLDEEAARLHEKIADAPPPGEWRSLTPDLVMSLNPPPGQR